MKTQKPQEVKLVRQEGITNHTEKEDLKAAMKKIQKEEGWKGYSPLRRNAEDEGKSWIWKEIEAY